MEYEIREEPLGYKPLVLREAVPMTVPYNIMIDPSGSCNFRCCFCPCNRAEEKQNVRHVIMKYEMFKKIVNGLKEFPEKVPVLDLYGVGEPFLNPNLIKMIHYIKKQDVCDYLRTTTNGSMLTPNISKQLVDSGLDYLKISVEGIRAESYKELCDVDIDFEQFVQNVAYLYRISRGKMKIGVKIISASFRDKKDQQKYMEIFSPITDYIYIRNVQKNWAEFYDMVIPGGKQDGVYAKNKVPKYEICSYPLTHMIVHANGDIAICCYDWKHETSYAHVEQCTIPQAWYSKELREIRVKHLKKQKNELPYCCSCKRKGYDNIDADVPTILERILR